CRALSRADRNLVKRKRIHFPRQIGLSKVAIGRGSPVDRTSQVQPPDDVCRLETERIRECQRISGVAGAEGVDVERKGLGETYAVGDLHFHPTGEAGADDLPGHVPGKVRPASIDLRRILPAEGAATVSAHTAVCIDYDLAAGQSGIDRRPALDEAVRWIDDEVDTLVVPIAEDAGHQLFANVL